MRPSLGAKFLFFKWVAAKAAGHLVVVGLERLKIFVVVLASAHCRKLLMRLLPG